MRRAASRPGGASRIYCRKATISYDDIDIATIRDWGPNRDVPKRPFQLCDQYRITPHHEGTLPPAFTFKPIDGEASALQSLQSEPDSRAREHGCLHFQIVDRWAIWSSGPAGSGQCGALAEHWPGTARPQVTRLICKSAQNRPSMPRCPAWHEHTIRVLVRQGYAPLP